MKYKQEIKDGFFALYSLGRYKQPSERYAHHDGTGTPRRGEGGRAIEPETAAPGQKEAGKRALSIPFYAKTPAIPHIRHAASENRM